MRILIFITFMAMAIIGAIGAERGMEERAYQKSHAYRYHRPKGGKR